ncbi:hypothetical protein PR202_ga12056 [Eleusine coracana subsp. coracana]|uniref:Uncharacterized protein n=1 Tax=Eleusine coracana subsp. coracana TaxID=191504 RepID=A0AAV5CB60_ELECO|nr:hypothetical protein PR202_ga12056 [Eleusine coracana subsp. coracana]
MFYHEVNNMMMVQHKNIVRILGYCSDTQGHAMEINGRYVMAEVRERLLCLEYLSKGSLENHLKGNTPLFLKCSHSNRIG